MKGLSIARGFGFGRNMASARAESPVLPIAGSGQVTSAGILPLHNLESTGSLSSSQAATSNSS